MPAAARNLLLVLLIATATHFLAVTQLPQDFDEPVYVQAAADYAKAIQRGDLNAVIDYPGVREHPALVKVVYGLVLFAAGEQDNFTQAVKLSRVVSAVFGLLATLLIAILDPLAGGLMAIQALVVKYTSQAYLEAIPLAMSVLSIFAFLKTDAGARGRWFWLSAFALGAATAGKFTYIPVTVVVLCYLAFFEKKTPIQWMVLYTGVAVAAFLALNLTLWHDPLSRMAEALAFHLGYQRGAHVQEVSYPWYQPFLWLFRESPGHWHPAVFFYDIDPFIALFAVAGLPREWRQRRWLVVWLIAGLLFLLLWGTKWPQYVLTIVPAICLMAAESMRQAYRWFRSLSYYKSI